MNSCGDEETDTLSRPVGPKGLKLIAESGYSKEYWIPAEELNEFNASIVGTIEVVAEFHAK
jgi:hypothetical protein